jgi:hypothetical protein
MEAEKLLPHKINEYCGKEDGKLGVVSRTFGYFLIPSKFWIYCKEHDKMYEEKEYPREDVDNYMIHRMKNHDHLNWYDTHIVIPIVSFMIKSFGWTAWETDVKEERFEVSIKKIGERELPVC